MDNFIVSARKYRPTTFESVVGQSHITTTLKNAIKSNHLAQAFLFCGPRGVGKTTCARILAKTINCENLNPAGEACGQCSSCHSFQENTSLTIHELDAASNNSVDDIRNLIDQVRYPPQSGKYKIYIIDEVHMLSTAAFNAFLKTLEEPPSYAIFILATTEKHKILPTILSRCQIFDFNRIQWKDMANHLAQIAQKENIQAEPAALELISIKADGGLRDALSMFDLNVTFSTDNSLKHKDVLENLHILDSDYYFDLTDFMIDQNHTETLLLVNEVMRKGFDGHQFISGFMEHLRHLLFAKDPKTLVLMEISDDTRNKFAVQSTKTSTSFLLSAMNICAQCEIHYKAAKNPRLHLELTLLKINYLPSVFKPTDISATEGGNGKKFESPIKGAKKHPSAVTNSTANSRAESNQNELNENIISNQEGKTEASHLTVEDHSPIQIKVGPEIQKDENQQIEIIESENPHPLETQMSENVTSHLTVEDHSPIQIKVGPETQQNEISQIELVEAENSHPIQTTNIEATKTSETTQFADQMESQSEIKKPIQGLKSAKKVVDFRSSQEIKNEASSVSEIENANITIEQVIKEWTIIAQKFKEANLINQFVLMDRKINLVDTNIHIQVENEMQVQQFNEHVRLDLISILRKNLNNHLIEITLDVIEPEKSDKKMLYTQSDKFEYLSEKHPMLIEMRNRLGLDHEF